MKTETTPRFNNAVTKLYNAFHNGTLDAFDCTACAVGNICNNQAEWSDLKGFICENPYAEQNKGHYIIKQTGYSVNELIKVEIIFVEHVSLSNSEEDQFKGLCSVVEYLCELDGIPNVMDYTCLFETENEKPKYELIF